MQKKSKILITFLGIFLFLTAFSQTNSKVKKISLNEGLSQSSVYDLLQDSRGFLWVGTQDGLNRYNGYEFNIFKHSPRDNKSISNNNINKISEDNNGVIWVATSYGLNKWDYKSQQFEWFLPKNTVGLKGSVFYNLFISSDNKLWFVNDKSVGYYDVTEERCVSFDNVSNGIDTTRENVKLCEDGKGQMWCVSRSGGAAVYDGSKWKEIVYDPTNPNSLPDNSIWDIKKGPDGTIWLATSYGIANYKGDELLFRNINSESHDLKIPFNDINDLVFDNHNHLWAVMYKKGVVKIDLLAEQVTHFNQQMKNGLTTDTVVNMEIDYSGNIWIKSYKSGIDVYNPSEEEFLHFKHDNMNQYSLSSNDITTIYPSRFGVVWIGTANNGLNMYNPIFDDFKHVTKNLSTNNTLSNSSVRRLLLDSKSRLWVGTDNGLNLTEANGNGFVNFSHNSSKKSLSNNLVSTIYEDNKNRIWIGTHEGLSYFKGDNSFKNYYFDENNTESNFIKKIYEDADSNLIIVHENFSFKKYDETTDSFKSINGYNFLKGEKYSCIKHLTPELTLYGTLNGFYLFNELTREYKQYTSNFLDLTSLSNPCVNDALLLHDTSLYIATMNGLNLLNLNTNEFTHYFIEDGLANQTIYNLLKDGNDNIWISTNFGLSVLNTYTNQFLNFDVNDGIQSNEFNHLACHTGNNGFLYFGGVNGYNYFNPYSINIESKQPKLYLTKLTVNGKKITVGDNSQLLNDEIDKIKSIILNYDQTAFELDFVAIDYLNADKIIYSYALNDPSEWISLKDQRKISFNHLAPGEYTLYIKALAADRETYSLKTLEIKIKPPFYTTPVFGIICIITLLVIIFSIFHLRTRSIQRHQKILKIKVRERTEEVVEQRDIALKQKDEIKVQKEIIEEKNKEITDSIAYAKRIQNAILPSSKVVKEFLKDSFIFYQPKDIVAGDFYWLEHKDNKVLFAAADCTGHGVPGAMVSVICNNALNRSVREYGLTDPGEILNKSREIIIQEFEKSDEEVKDGMDIAICSLEGNKLLYAGANNPLWIIRNKKLIETKADKQPIGKFYKPTPYTTHTFDLKKNDLIYIFSDGFIDQFGGEEGKKFKTAGFRKLLLSISEKSMEEQHKLIINAFTDWKKNVEQIDDICVIGLRV